MHCEAVRKAVVMATAQVITQKAMGRLVLHNFDSSSSHRNDSCFDVTFEEERKKTGNDSKMAGKWKAKERYNDDARSLMSVHFLTAFKYIPLPSPWPIRADYSSLNRNYTVHG